MELLLIGLGLGLAAGFSPGPLLTLVVAASLDRGLGAGLRVAVAPLLTDAPIILLALVLLKDLPPSLLTFVGILGGCLVIVLGVRTMTTRPRTEAAPDNGRATVRFLWQGALVNLFNPHPWLGWATVLGPTLIQAWRQSPGRGIAFVAGFYAAIVGSKATVAWGVAVSRRRLSSAWLGRLLHSSGMLLVILGLVLLWRAIRPPV